MELLKIQRIFPWIKIHGYNIGRTHGSVKRAYHHPLFLRFLKVFERRNFNFSLKIIRFDLFLIEKLTKKD